MPFTIPLSWLIAPLLALATAAGGYWAGDHNRNNAWLALQAQAQIKANADLQAAQVRGDRLSNALLASERQIDQQRGEIHHALNQATIGRPCLNGAALRLLQSSPGISVDRLPAATGGTATTGAAAAPDPDDGAVSSTDTQLANWIADAGAAYGVCRARLDALIDWHFEKTNP